MPCLAALYALLYGDATSACMEPVLMMRPQPPASMPGSAALVVWKAEVRHTAIMASHLRRRPRVAAAPRPRRPARLEVMMLALMMSDGVNASSTGKVGAATNLTHVGSEAEVPW